MFKSCCAWDSQSAFRQAYAAYEPDVTGNSYFSVGSGTQLLQGHVNFAVYNNTSGGDWRTPANIPVGSAVLMAGDSTGVFQATSVLFLQVTRTEREAANSTTLLQYFDVPAIPIEGVQWLGGGFLTNFGDNSTVFTYNFADVTGFDESTNNSLGLPSDSMNTTLGVTFEGYSPNEFAVDPAAGGLNLTGAGDGGPRYTFSILPTEGIQDGGHSSVLFLPTNMVSSFFDIRDGVFTSDIGTASLFKSPVPTPEPGSLLLMSVGLIGGLAGAAWRRRKHGTDAVGA